MQTVEFLGLSFLTQIGVLIPRLETECLVEYAIKHTPKHSSVLEIGVGSGIISICLALKREDLKITGCDINPLALKLTLKNMGRILNDTQTITLVESDCFKNINGRFDVIISNPPYVSQEEFLSSDQELKYEPRDALITEHNGLYFFERLATQCLDFLNPKGLLILEISEYREKEIISIFQKKMFSLQDTILDYLDHKRALVFQKI